MMASGMAMKETVFNEAILAFDALFSGSVISAALTAPPSSPADGDCYIVATSPTGAWAGQANKIAFAYNGWQFITPPNQYRLYNQATSGFMVYTTSSGWTVASSGTGPTHLTDLLDVNASSPTDGQVLKYDVGAHKWVPWTVSLPTYSTPNLHDLPDVNVTEGAGIDGKFLKYDNATSKWIAAAAPTAPTFATLADVDATSFGNGKLASWSTSTNKVEFISPSSLAIVGTLSAVGDVTYTGGLHTNDVLTWNGAAWQPSSSAIHFTFEQMTDGPGTMVGAAGKVLIVNTLETALEYADLATFLAAASIKLVNMTDVNVTEGAGIDGKFLKFDNASGKWIPSSVPAALTVNNGSTVVDTAASILNITGSGVTVSDATAGTVHIDIPGAAAPVTYQDHGTDQTQPTKINFAGLCSVAESGGVLTLTVNGVSTLAALTDVGITTPATGDILTYDAGTSKWKNSSLSIAVAALPNTLSPATYEFGPQAPPLTTMLATLWHATGVTMNAQPGRGLLVVPGTYGATDYMFAGHALVNNTPPFTMTARIAATSDAAPGHYAGIAIRRDATTKLAFIGVSSNTGSGAPGITFSYYDGTVETSVASETTDYQWVRIGFDGTNVKAWISKENLIWKLIGTVNASTILGGTPTHVGVAQRVTSAVSSNAGGLYTYYDDPDYPAGARTTLGVASVGLNDLTNVDAASPTDGQALVWNVTAGKWEPSTPAATLAALTDVNVTEGSGIDGQALVFHNSTGKWISQAFPAWALSGLSDVSVTEGSGINNYALIWNNGASKWEATALPSGTLATLTDVNVSEGSGIDGYALTWNNSTGKWVATALASGALSGLSDVNVTEGSGINGYTITWNNSTSKWVATALATVATSGAYSDLSGLPSLITTLAGLGDVNVSEGVGIDGQFLKWDNGTSKWVASAIPGGVTTLAGLSDVNVSEGSGINGYALTWNNSTSKWVATSISGGASALSGLSDVNVTEGSTIDGANLQWKNADGKWEAVKPPYKVGFFFTSTPASSETLLMHVCAAAFSLSINFAGSQGYVGTNPTSSATLTVKKNGSSIGTIGISTSGVVTFSAGSATSFAAGDLISVVAPSTADATLANCAFTLLGA